MDDHRILIDGLKLLLSGTPNIQLVAESNTAAELLLLLKTIEVDVLVTDILMSEMDGYELVLAVKKQFPAIKTLALSMSEEGSMIEKMIDRAKVDGYIPKASGKKELITAIQSVANGVPYFAESIKEQYESYKKLKTENKTLNLTNRELQIIQCIIHRLSNKDIAAKLFISERTVETHRKNIYRKTNTKGVATLVEFVQLHQLVPNE